MGMKKSEAKTNAAIRMIHLLRGEKFIQSVQPRHILTGVVFIVVVYRQKLMFYETWRFESHSQQVLVLQASLPAEATKPATKWLSFKSSAKNESSGHHSTPTSKAV